MHGGSSPGAPKGNRNALEHGHYTAENRAEMRRVRALIRSAKPLADEVG